MRTQVIAAGAILLLAGIGFVATEIVGFVHAAHARRDLAIERAEATWCTDDQGRQLPPALGDDC